MRLPPGKGRPRPALLGFCLAHAQRQTGHALPPNAGRVADFRANAGAPACRPLQLRSRSRCHVATCRLVHYAGTNARTNSQRHRGAQRMGTNHPSAGRLHQGPLRMSFRRVLIRSGPAGSGHGHHVYERLHAVAMVGAQSLAVGATQGALCLKPGDGVRFRQVEDLEADIAVENPTIPWLLRGQLPIDRETLAWMRSTPILDSLSMSLLSDRRGWQWRCGRQSQVGPTQTLLALVAWQIEHGELPESLDQLVGPYLDRLPRQIVAQLASCCISHMGLPMRSRPTTIAGNPNCCRQRPPSCGPRETG